MVAVTMVSNTPLTRLVVNSTKPRSLTCLATFMPACAASPMAREGMAASARWLACSSANSTSVSFTTLAMPSRTNSRSPLVLRLATASIDDSQQAAHAIGHRLAVKHGAAERFAIPFPIGLLFCL
ncbi:MAG: hypothetical protein HC853_11535 [Anaerolineae bacterium]|nr:hypothetical protein [Anaerolineae bacterium]